MMNSALERYLSPLTTYGGRALRPTISRSVAMHANPDAIDDIVSAWLAYQLGWYSVAAIGGGLFDGAVWEGLTHDETIRVHETGDGDVDVWHSLTLATLMDGAALWAARTGLWIFGADADYDATDADAVVQLALFGEVRYG